MQAILLLAHKGVDYIDKFCNQFSNVYNFNVYIHQDTKNPLSISDINYLYVKHKNIKKIISEIDCKYSDISIIDAELLLIKEALKDNNTYIHLLSEQCYTVVDEDCFYDFFKHNSKEYIRITDMFNSLDFTVDESYKRPNFWRAINNKYHYFGGQWFSLTSKLLNEICGDNRLISYYDELKEYATNPNNDSHRQAIDEVFFQNFIMEYGYIQNYNIEFNTDLRFVDWYNKDSNNTHPGFISTKYNQLNRIYNNNYLIVRKVDYKQEDSIKQLNIIKDYYKQNIYGGFMKKVSVCMCTRNRATLMLGAIKSILTQTYKNIELIIVDDASTDNTEEVINNLSKTWSNIKYIKLREHNFINARNTAFDNATGDYIALIDSDDMCSPNKIEEQVKFFEEHPELDVVGCKIKFGKKTSNLSIPKSLQLWANNYFQNEIKLENISMLLHFPAIMFKRELLDRFDNHIYFYPELSNGGEDQIFLYTLYMKGAKFGNCTGGTYLYNYLEYGDAISATAGKHFDENNFIFKYIHGKPFADKMNIVNELYNKYNTKI